MGSFVVAMYCILYSDDEAVEGEIETAAGAIWRRFGGDLEACFEASLSLVMRAVLVAFFPSRFGAQFRWNLAQRVQA